jgi:RNA polymerase sigma factor for flagellar operon FliA
VRIRGSVLDELRRMDWVPRSVHAKARRIQATLADLENQLRRVPTDSEVAGALQISVEEYRRWLDQVRPASFVCLDAVQSPDGDDDCSEHEVIADVTQQDASEKATQSEMVGLIAERIQALPELHRKIIAFYYYEGMRLREIAEICDLSESRICQIHTQVVLSLKAHLEAREAVVMRPN